MKDKVLLIIDTRNGCVAVPFLGIQEVDEFTVRFNNQDMLADSLIKILRLPIKLKDVISIYVSYEYTIPKKGTTNTKRLDIKYINDNYDLDSLRDVFTRYLIQEPTRIKDSNIRYLKSSAMMDFIYDDKPMSEREIGLAVSSYLKRGYKTNRDVYFGLKRKGYKVKIKPYVFNDSLNDRKISDFDTDDEFFDYLKKYSKMGEEESERAMEIIAGYDLEDLRGFKNDYNSIVDGVYNDKLLDLDDVRSLEELSNISIECLTELVNKNYKENKKKKR